MLSLSCEECGEEIEVASDKQGKTIGCPACEHAISVPWEDDSSSSPDANRVIVDNEKPLPLLSELETNSPNKLPSRWKPLLIRLRWHLAELFTLSRTFARRVLDSNCATVKPLPKEREQLEQDTPAITDDLAQRYLCWRRSMLWYAALVWVIIAIFSTWDWIQLMSTGDSESNATVNRFGFAFNAMMTLAFAMQMIGYVAIAWAAWQWNHVSHSIWLSRLGWLMIFFSPFIFMLFPAVSFVRFEESTLPEEEMVIGFVLGTGLLISVIPFFIGVLPALIRSMLTLKTLLPEFAGLGWFLVVIVPIYSLGLLTIGFAVNQVGFFPMLIAGSLCIALAPIAYVLDRNLFRPQQQDAASELIINLRKRVRFITGMGCLLVLIFLTSNGDVRTSFRVIVNQLSNNAPTSWVIWHFLAFVVKLFGSIVLLTVVACDIVVFALLRWHEQQFDDEEARLAEQLQIKLGRLHQAGFSKSLQLPQLPQFSGSQNTEEDENGEEEKVSQEKENTVEDESTDGD